MIKYYCDKCGKEIKGTRHKINIQQDMRPVDYLMNTCRDAIKEQINDSIYCQDCIQHIMRLIIGGVEA